MFREIWSIAIVAAGLLALGLTPVGVLPFALQLNATTCTITVGGTGCQVGGGLYVTGFDVAATPYSGSYVVIIGLTVNNTGSNPVTITTVQFDGTALQNGAPASGGLGSGTWSSSGNPVAYRATSLFIINLPATSSSSRNGVHTITLVDSSGSLYTFAIGIFLDHATNSLTTTHPTFTTILTTSTIPTTTITTAITTAPTSHTATTATASTIVSTTSTTQPPPSPPPLWLIVSIVGMFAAFVLAVFGVWRYARFRRIQPTTSVEPRPPSQREAALSTADERLYSYITEHDGTISLSAAASDLGMSMAEIDASISRLRQAGRIE